MKKWCIINLNDLRDPDLYNLAHLNCEILDLPIRMLVFYFNRDIAEAEMLRLTKKYGEGYFLFESVATVIESQIMKGAFHIKRQGG
jgi:hypothetical protein